MRCSPGGSAADSTRSSPGVRPARLPALPRRAGADSGGRAAALRLHNRAAGRARSPSAAGGRLPAPAGEPPEPAALRGASACQPGRNSFGRKVGFLGLPRWGAGNLSERHPERAFHLRAFTWARRARWVCGFLPGGFIFGLLGRFNGLL